MNKIESLSGCKQLLNWTYLYKDCDWKIGRYKVPNKYSAIAFIVLYTGTLLMEIWLICVQQFNPHAIAQCIGAIQMVLIYVSLMQQKSLIIKTIDRLQETIDNCKFTHRHIKIEKANECHFVQRFPISQIE